MAKQHVAEQETLGEAMNRTELFFEKNGRNMAYIFLGLLVLAALIFGYRALIVAPRATKAAERIAEAQYRFEEQNPDYQLALEGDANGAGFLDVIERVRFDSFGQPRQALCGYLLPEDGRSGERRQISGEILAGQGHPRSAHQRPESGPAGRHRRRAAELRQGGEILRAGRQGRRQQPDGTDVPAQGGSGRAGSGQQRKGSRILRADSDLLSRIDGCA